jgi:Phage integrase, N-terminal SAM-like domain
VILFVIRPPSACVCSRRLPRRAIRYRGPDGRERNKSFTRKVDARYLTGVEHSKLADTYVDPSRSKITVQAWGAQWLAAQTHLKPSTRARYEGILSKHIEPRWGRTPLSQVGHADVARWVAELDLAAASVRDVHRVFSLLLELAVQDGRISKNPATGVRTPERSRPKSAS